ncbi:MAG: putative Ig domain-containing protein [Firmicutes bacterium]|nr:putative Ig domain-containing protein [Bacillota bacterium]
MERRTHLLLKMATPLLLGIAALLTPGCKDLVEAPSALVYSENPATYTAGTPISPNTATHKGGAIDTYAVSPALPAGLTLNKQSGEISGTPSMGAATATYVITATNVTGSTTANLSITVNPSVVTITGQPVSQTVVVSQVATFSVVATGAGTLHYQWMKNGTALPGATSASYSTPPTSLADDGAHFSVQVTDGFGGSATSVAVTLTVQAAGGPGTCTPTANLNAARVFHTATLLGNGKVLIAGGFNGTLALASAELYDPVAGTFSSTGSMVTPRQAHTATLLANGKVLLSGGVSLGTTLASAELYDPATGQFTATGSLGAARSDHSATLLSNGKVLMVGGRDLAAYLATAELYDPATGQFVATAGAPLTSRATHSATLLSNGKVLVAGGFRSSALSTAELYDPATGHFAATASLNVARAYHRAIPLPGGQVLILGGAASTGVERYDPATETFAVVGNLQAARDHWHTATLLPTGKVLVAGGVGVGSPAPILASTELYDPVSGTSSLSGPLGTQRESHSATLLSNGKVLLAGGMGFGYLASAELYY